MFSGVDNRGQYSFDCSFRKTIHGEFWVKVGGGLLKNKATLKANEPEEPEKS